MSLIRPAAAGRFRAEALFRPGSVALLGADTPVGAQVLGNMLAAGFTGMILPVAQAASVRGVLAYRDVPSLPVVPDLAVLAGSGPLGPALSQLAARGCFAACCLVDEPDLAAASRAAGMRVLGPYSFGVCIPALGLNATTAHVQPRAGRVALVSQSAALCRAVLDWAEPNGVGFSHVVGVGGNADFGFAPVLDWLSRDPGTGAILLDIRTLRDRRAFLSAARAAARLRPVVAIHAGGRLSDPSGRADAVFDAALRRAGIVRVTRLADLLAAAETLTRARPARGERLAIATNAVGPGQMAADAVLAAGLALADPPADAAAMQAGLPAGAVQDGLLWTGGDTPARLADAVTLLAADPGVGGVLAVLAPVADADRAVDALAGVMAKLKVPLLACAMGETTGARHRLRLAEAGIPAFASPELAVRGFEHLVQYRRARAAAQELPPSTVLTLAPDRASVAAQFAAVRAAGRRTLMQEEALHVLAAYGLRTVPTEVALTEDEAVRWAVRLGYPAVLKLRRNAQPRPGGPGGVALDLHDEDAVRQAVRGLAARRDRLPDGAVADGLLVQSQAGRARELRLCAVEDPVFGPAIGFGQGGSAADLLGDVAWDLPPLNLPLARALVARTRAARTLAELPDQPAADTDAVADALVRVSQLLVDFPEIDALDLNPVFADRCGVLVADAWLSLRPPGEAGRLALPPYPAELEAHWTTKGSKPAETLLVRPIRPEDAEAHAALFRRLSPEDVRFRFFSTLRELSAEQIARMTQVDYEREMAFVAVREATGETVGVARLVREAYADRGEFAVLVESSMKGRGLARHLMERLIDWGRSRGMTEIVGQVLAENAPMLAFMRRLGFAVHRLAEEPDVVEARMALA